MSLRPIDMQTSVQRSSEIKNVQNNEAHRPEVAQQQFAARFQKEVMLQEQQVQQSHKSLDGRINRDAGGGKNAKQKKGSQSEKKKEGAGQGGKYSEESTSMLDITI